MQKHSYVSYYINYITTFALTNWNNRHGHVGQK